MYKWRVTILSYYHITPSCEQYRTPIRRCNSNSSSSSGWRKGGREEGREGGREDGLLLEQSHQGRRHPLLDSNRHLPDLARVLVHIRPFHRLEVNVPGDPRVDLRTARTARTARQKATSSVRACVHTRVVLECWNVPCALHPVVRVTVWHSSAVVAGALNTHNAPKQRAALCVWST